MKNIFWKKGRVDKETSGVREIHGNRAKIVAVIAVVFSLFQIYINSIGNVQEIYRNAIHLAFLLLLTFLLFPGRKRSPKDRFSKFDVALGVAGVISALYIVVFYTDIHGVRNSQAIMQDYIFAVIAIVLTLEAARRTIGWFVPILSIIALIYALFGPYFPGMFAHAGFTFERLLFRMYMTTEGLLGITIAISSTYIFLFILFGAFLKKSGASELFTDISVAIAGKYRGGPAKVAVVSSGMMGMLNGSAVANVATTGSFTIPLMKRIGYRSRFAGAVEAASSTGGMIMPPIMGAAAFIMVGFLGVPYSTILIAGILPAFLYYIGILVMVDIEAKRMGLKGLSKDSIPKILNVLKDRGALLLPIIVVIWALMDGRTPMFAGFAGIITTIVASWFNPKTRLGIKDIINALEDGAKAALQVGVATAACGIVVGVVAMTSVGSTLAYQITNLAGGHLPVALVYIMITSIILSLGLPSTALYIIVAVTAAPALVEMGVSPIAAHFFVFFFGALSNVTPPVALASFTASGIAGSEPMKTSWTGLKLTLAGFIIPFIFVYNPILLHQGPNADVLWKVVLTVITAILGIYALAVTLSNYLNHRLKIVERIFYGACALLLIIPGWPTDVIGLVTFGILVFVHMTINRNQSVGNEVRV